MYKQKHVQRNKRKQILSKVHSLKPEIRIGKSGLTDSVIAEVRRRMKTIKILKVKFLSSGIAGKNKKALFQELAEKTRSRLVHSVGFVATLQKRK